MGVKGFIDPAPVFLSKRVYDSKCISETLAKFYKTFLQLILGNK